MNDDRISRYLSNQAEGITLAPADPDGAMRRGNRRRTRRRAGLLGGVAVVGVLATSVAVRDTSPDESIDLADAQNAIASTYEWSTTEPGSGLGYGGQVAQLSDGTVYSISTAPGPYREGDVYQSTLYSSDDGAEWAVASQPDGIRSADLAGGGETLYSVGTSPAGGLVVSSSTDGAASWSSAALPGDVAALKERNGDRIVLGSPRVAAQDGSHVVATVVATTSTDPALYGHPEINEAGNPWTWDDTGLHVYEVPDEECSSPITVVSDDAESADPVALAGVDGRACRAMTANGGPDLGDPVASYTFDQLGIDGELREHVGGRTYAYVSDDGASFAPATLPDAVAGLNNGFVADVVATDDGYRMFIGNFDEASSTTTVLRSVDGHDWSVDATFDGSPGDVGTLGGRAALSVWASAGGSTVRVQQPDGSWTSIDLVGAVSTPDGFSTYVGSVAFGPLGLAAVVGTSNDDPEGEPSYDEAIVHSTDGGTLQVVEVEPLVQTGGTIAGLVVTTDAIAARVISPDDGKAGTPASQKVLVGTPTG